MSRQKLLGNLKRGLSFVLSAPAGAGKSTLVDLLTDEFPEVVRSISCTTRHPRKDEQNGVHYHFLTDAEFERKIAEDEFIEHVTLFGHRYGTSKAFLNQSLDTGKHVFLVIDTQGALKLMGKMDAVFIFVMPPSIQELERRLSLRGSETQDTLTTRLSEAKREIEASKAYDYIIINDNLQTAYQVLRSIVIAEEHKGKYDG